MPKITFKKIFFRIFWKILAKTGPQSLYLCGFPEAIVEMEVAPFRALTQFMIAVVNCYIHFCRNGGRPFQGIDTLKELINVCIFIRRNGGRPFQGIDTIRRSVITLMISSRNGGRPFQGIDTTSAPVRQIRA